jgi:hypothetical protein
MPARPLPRDLFDLIRNGCAATARLIGTAESGGA